MERSVPIWVFRVVVLLLVVAALWFGWTVKGAVPKQPHARSVTEMTVLKIAEYPDMAMAALQQVRDQITGDAEDRQFRVLREADKDYSGFQPVAAGPEIGLQGLLLRASPERMVPGWRLIAGIMTIEGAVGQSVLLMSPDNRIVHRWALSEEAIGEYEPRPPSRKFVHGVEALPDGSLIFAYDGGISLQRFDKCSLRIWSRPGTFNHAVTLDEGAETLWSLGSPTSFVQVEARTGDVLQSFDIRDLLIANPGLDILELRKRHDNDAEGNSRNTAGRWLVDPFHLNDVDPLPAALADRFPGFEVGDLMISARSLNLVFVVDPDTLKIKWWRMGAVRRQHDPDWQPDGRITIFDNRMGRDYSQIIALDPVTFEREVLFDGRQNDFYTRIRGKHQVLEDGTLVISSPQQGRAFEVDPGGEIVFEMVNTKPGSDKYNYTISELRWLPPDFFDVEDWSCPEKN